MSERWWQFSLRELLGWTVVIAFFCLLASMIAGAKYQARQSAYGGQRMSRWQAEVIHRGPVNLPDSEFRQLDSPSESLPQRGQPFP